MLPKLRDVAIASANLSGAVRPELARQTRPGGVLRIRRSRP